ncbi:DUF4070 domain-containing protein [bacterium]|nr:MAG: DUF4070 domain-containing protein [bacterium]
MNALLVYPEFPETFWSFKHAVKFVGRKAANPPLGLLTVAALLPSEWNKRLVDLNVRKLEKKDLEWADVALVSAMTVQKESARQVIRLLKENGVRVVAGGPLFTVTPEEFPEVDHLVLNEGELTLPAFLSDFAEGRAGRLYSSADYADLGRTPAPLWGLINPRDYAAMSIQYSRGCPFRCEFCNVTALLGHKPRTKSTEQIITELDSLRRLGWKASVFFVDDNFIGKKHELKNELLPALIRWQREHRQLSFFTEASIDLADDPELVDMMVAAGFNMVFIGIETPHEESLAEAKKLNNCRRDLLRDVKYLQRSGLEVQGGFIVGFDSDPPDIFRLQREFIQKSGIVTAMVGMLQAIPGTRLYERLQREGRLKGQCHGDNVASSTNIVPLMGIEKLQTGYRDLLENLYSPKHFYRRLGVFLREYRLPRIQAKLDFQHKMAFFRSVFHLGLVGKERFHYWKLIAWTTLTHPRMLPVAVTLAIYGHHFRIVCERNVLKEGC